MKFRKIFKSLIVLPVAIAPTVCFTACNKNDKVQTITVSGETKIGAGGTTQYTATISPETAKIKTVTWSVDDETYATIDQNGLLTAKTIGTVKVIATANDGTGVTGSISVEIVQSIPVTSITISKKDIPTKLEVDSSTKLGLEVLPSTATNKNVTWTVNPSSVAKVENGILIGLAAGTATVTASANDGSGIVSNSLSIEVINQVTSTETYEDYIFNRAFSISGIGSTYLTYGTGWILSDATPTITDDFKYYIATNWHVIKGMEEVGATKYKYACEHTSGQYLSQSDFIEFTSFEPIAQVNFTYDGKTTITIDQTTGLQGCDVYIAKVDFASCKSSTKACASIVKQKLNTLNSITQLGRKITNLAPTTTDSTHYESVPLYTGGYPSETHNGPLWEKHDLSAESISLNYGAKSTQSSSGLAHSADSSNSMFDCSPQYYSSGSLLKNWMTGGASGSMIIGNFGTASEPVWKVVGIYWGGRGYKEYDPSTGKVIASYIKPYFSIFNSDWKNYLAEWM